MAATGTDTFTHVQDTFFSHVRDIEYATMITVDRRNRPRARVLLPVREIADGRPAKPPTRPRSRRHTWPTARTRRARTGTPAGTPSTSTPSTWVETDTDRSMPGTFTGRAVRRGGLRPGPLLAQRCGC